MDKLTQQISTIIQSFKQENGAHALWLMNQTNLSLGDESSNLSIIYKENPPNNATNEESHSFYKLTNNIYEQIFKLRPEWFENIPPLLQNGLHLLIVTPNNDTFQIQVSDHYLHINIHYSGQY